MTEKSKTDFKSVCLIFFSVLSIAAISFFTYGDILNYFFVGVDNISHIDALRITSFNDILAIFNNPLGYNIPVVDKIQKSYRPACALLFSFDYSVWQLDPFGFHLTDIILQTLTSISVFFFIRLITAGDNLKAWIGAVLFTSHPLLIEGIPVTVRRCDTVTALFVVSSISLYIRHFQTGFRKSGYLPASLVFYLLALGSKEIAVILPFTIFVYIFTLDHSEGRSLKNILLFSLIKSMPFHLLTIIYLAWRTYVLKGIGGYIDKSSGLLNKIQLLINIGTDYLVNLVYPVDFIRLDQLFSPYTSGLRQAIFLLLMLAFSLLIWFNRGRIRRLASDNDHGINRFMKGLLLAMIIMSIAGILIYPVLSPYINSMIENAYAGHGIQLLSKQIENRGGYNVDVYFYKFRGILTRLLLLSLFFSTLLFSIIHKRKELAMSLSGSANTKTAVFLSSWMLLPLGIYLAEEISGRYYLYIAVIPFAAFLSIWLVESFRYLSAAVKSDTASNAPSLSSRIICFAAAAVLSLSLITYSPLFRNYGEWQETGKIVEKLLSKLSGRISDIQKGKVLHIYNFPDRILSYQKVTPHAHDIAYINDYNIESWLKLKHPEFSQTIIIESRQKLESYPEEFDLELQHNKEGNINIIIKYDFGDRR